MVSRQGSNQFSRRLALKADRFEANAQRMIQEAAQAALEILVLGTRVDTGVARSNWRVTADSPAVGQIEAYNPYPKHSSALGQGIGETANAASALAEGVAVIDSFRIGVDPDLFITNNVRYLRFIPDGEISDLTREAADAARIVLRTAKLL